MAQVLEAPVSLKTERTARKTYRTRDDAQADVFDYIERFYNAKRRHPTIGKRATSERGPKRNTDASNRTAISGTQRETLGTRYPSLTRQSKKTLGAVLVCVRRSQHSDNDHLIDFSSSRDCLSKARSRRRSSMASRVYSPYLSAF